MKQAGLLGNGDLAAYMTEYAAATAKEPTLDDQNHVNQVRNFCQKLGVILTDTADDMATKYNALFKKYRMLNVYGKAF
ncbi:hypothetical protein, partial [Streptomyces brasiliscabiei]|uniref:hypothetical protein n=1 Tax=Streptomyces brasiliscabiei TaxID=2736302 RepID=UPI003014562A